MSSDLSGVLQGVFANVVKNKELAHQLQQTGPMLALLCILMPSLVELYLGVQLWNVFRTLFGAGAFVILLMTASAKTVSQAAAPAAAAAPKCDAQPGAPKVETKPSKASYDDGNVSTSASGLSSAEDPEPRAVSFRQLPEERRPTMQPSASPAVNMSFSAGSLDGQLAEVVEMLEPTAACRAVVDQLQSTVRSRVRQCLGGAEVDVTLTSPFHRSTPYAAAVPEIEVVVSAPAEAIYQYMQRSGAARRVRGDLREYLKAGEAQKQALRALIKTLLSCCDDFRFRRSSFAQQEAKVVLVAPHLGTESQVVAFDFSLNTTWSFRNAELWRSCAELLPEARSLLLIVRRWAKVRGMCIACQGYLSPYVWSILVIYFLQVGGGGADPVLPTFWCSTGEDDKPVVMPDDPVGDAAVTVAELLKGFLRFYSQEFAWGCEDVDLSRGARPSAAKAAGGGGEAVGCPRIPDPFQQAWNLGGSLTADGFKHVYQEFERAVELFQTKEAPMMELLEQWVPESCK